MSGRVDNVGGDSNILVLETEGECSLLTKSVFTSLSVQTSNIIAMHYTVLPDLDAVVTDDTSSSLWGLSSLNFL